MSVHRKHLGQRQRCTALRAFKQHTQLVLVAAAPLTTAEKRESVEKVSLMRTGLMRIVTTTPLCANNG
jgi:hypothetical protein